VLARGVIGFELLVCVASCLGIGRACSSRRRAMLETRVLWYVRTGKRRPSRVA